MLAPFLLAGALALGMPTGVSFADHVTPAVCPSPTAAAATVYTRTGEQLYAPQSFAVMAGGGFDLSDCFEDMFGNVAGPADFAFTLRGMVDYKRLMISVESDCDTVLLVRDPARRWFYDDDTEVLNPVLELVEPADGVYHVWVGTYESSLCEATLSLETFFN